MYECIRWGKRGARLNDIAPGIIVTPLAVDEFNGPTSILTHRADRKTQKVHNNC